MYPNFQQMTYSKQHQYNSRDEFFNARLASLKIDINHLSKDEVLNLDQNDYIEYLYHKYFLEPLHIIQESETVHEPEHIKREIDIAQ
ncbi:MAG: hypothetical protein K2I84_00435, partial [Bacteroidales bacterium]|nr:hypothetical protein [Bacteroidales bacterium]